MLAAVALLSLALCGQVAGFLPAPVTPSPSLAFLGSGTAGSGLFVNPQCLRSIASTAASLAPVRPSSLSLKAADGGPSTEATKTLITRLQASAQELTALKASVSAEVDELQAALAEKKASLTLIDDRLEKVSAEIKSAETEVKIASTEIMPATIVGDGRVGHMMKSKGDTSDVMVRSTSEMKFQLKKNPGGSGKEGPIYLCVPNSALEELIEACPEDRREDLVFMGSGSLDDFLDEKGLSACTQALIYFQIGKLGEEPVDGVTELDPEGLTCAVGKWAPDLAKRLRKVDMSCKILSPAEFEVSRAERLVWTCSVHLVAKFHDLRTIGAVLEDKYWKETEACMRELASAVHSTSGVEIQENFYARMKMYTESVGVFNAVVKDLPFRNGYFYDMTTNALNKGQADPCPLHTKMLKKIKAVK